MQIYKWRRRPFCLGLRQKNVQTDFNCLEQNSIKILQKVEANKNIIIAKIKNFKKKLNWAENLRMGDIGINAWSFLFDNLKINLILQDYLKSVWKTIKFKLIFNHLRNCSSQSEKSGQPMRKQKYSHWRKQLTAIQEERKRVD